MADDVLGGQPAQAESTLPQGGFGPGQLPQTQLQVYAPLNVDAAKTNAEALANALQVGMQTVGPALTQQIRERSRSDYKEGMTHPEEAFKRNDDGSFQLDENGNRMFDTSSIAGKSASFIEGVKRAGAVDAYRQVSMDWEQQKQAASVDANGNTIPWQDLVAKQDAYFNSRLGGLVDDPVSREALYPLIQAAHNEAAGQQLQAQMKQAQENSQVAFDTEVRNLVTNSPKDDPTAIQQGLEKIRTSYLMSAFGGDNARANAALVETVGNVMDEHADPSYKNLIDVSRMGTQQRKRLDDLTDSAQNKQQQIQQIGVAKAREQEEMKLSDWITADKPISMGYARKMVDAGIWTPAMYDRANSQNAGLKDRLAANQHLAQLPPGTPLSQLEGMPKQDGQGNAVTNNSGEVQKYSPEELGAIQSGNIMQAVKRSGGDTQDNATWMQAATAISNSDGRVYDPKTLAFLNHTAQLTNSKDIDTLTAMSKTLNPNLYAQAVNDPSRHRELALIGVMSRQGMSSQEIANYFGNDQIQARLKNADADIGKINSAVDKLSSGTRLSANGYWDDVHLMAPSTWLGSSEHRSLGQTANGQDFKDEVSLEALQMVTTGQADWSHAVPAAVDAVRRRSVTFGLPNGQSVWAPATIGSQGVSPDIATAAMDDFTKNEKSGLPAMIKAHNDAVDASGRGTKVSMADVTVRPSMVDPNQFLFESNGVQIGPPVPLGSYLGADGTFKPGVVGMYQARDLARKSAARNEELDRKQRVANGTASDEDRLKEAGINPLFLK